MSYRQLDVMRALELIAEARRDLAAGRSAMLVDLGLKFATERLHRGLDIQPTEAAIEEVVKAARIAA